SLLVSSFFFFFIMLRPPLRSTLFPYTTLFRSLLDVFRVQIRLGVIHVEDLVLARHAHERAMGFLRPPPDAQHVDTSRHFLGVGQDRKSTRLNSSHVSISYAVFCLKKKIKEHKH